jgi:hypothetical protein
VRRLLVAILLSAGVTTVFGSPQLRVATFRCYVIPELDEPLIWVTPAAKIDDPLWAKGVTLDNGHARYVLCAVDWCGLGGSAHFLFRRKIAAAAGRAFAEGGYEPSAANAGLGTEARVKAAIRKLLGH